METGNWGDHRSVGEDVFEFRFFFGSGYRYYGEVDNTLVLLICGGDKSSQKILIAGIPNHIKDDVQFIAFRFSGLKPMVGYRDGAVFHIVWSMINFLFILIHNHWAGWCDSGRFLFFRWEINSHAKLTALQHAQNVDSQTQYHNDHSDINPT